MTDRYGPGAIRFHWLMAVLIVVVGVLGPRRDGVLSRKWAGKAGSP